MNCTHLCVNCKKCCWKVETNKKEKEKNFVRKFSCTFTCVNIKYKMIWCTNLCTVCHSQYIECSTYTVSHKSIKAGYWSLLYHVVLYIFIYCRSICDTIINYHLFLSYLYIFFLKEKKKKYIHDVLCTWCVRDVIHDVL